LQLLVHFELEDYVRSLAKHGCRNGCAPLPNSCVKKFWLVKQEPSAYSWANFVADRKTGWTGVRNYTARNNLRSMRNGDAVLFYHSVTDKAVVGIAKVIQEAYPDATAREGDWRHAAEHDSRKIGDARDGKAGRRDHQHVVQARQQRSRLRRASQDRGRVCLISEIDPDGLATHLAPRCGPR